MNSKTDPIEHSAATVGSAGAIIDAMTPVSGEERAACQCGKCGQIFGRRYIPGGIGRGLTIDPCGCVLTNNQHGDFFTVLTARP